MERSKVHCLQHAAHIARPRGAVMVMALGDALN